MTNPSDRRTPWICLHCGHFAVGVGSTRVRHACPMSGDQFELVRYTGSDQAEQIRRKVDASRGERSWIPGKT